MKKWIFSLLFVAFNAYAQDLITKVVPLHYVEANQIIRLVKPLLGADEKISGEGQTLVLKVSPQTLTQIREVIRQLDVAPVTFLVEIHQDTPDWLSAQNSNTVTYSTQPQSETLRNQAVKVSSGESALVATDTEVPIVSAVGVGFYTGIAYQQHQIKNGLLVHPTMQGSQVRLEVKRLREQANPSSNQSFDNQKIDTTLMVPLNKWVMLGSAQGWQKMDSSATVYTAGRSFSNNATLYVKVSLAQAS